MKPETKMLAELISVSLNLGEDWRVVDVEMREYRRSLISEAVAGKFKVPGVE